MPPKTKFVEGEKVLCFHGPLIYEAKALKHQIMKDKQVKYFIHYAGWNKNWDEWVPENRVLKYNEANVQRQKEVHKQHANATGKNKKAASKKGGKGEKDSDSRASTPSKDLTKEGSSAAAQSSTVSSSTSASSSSTASGSEDSKLTAAETTTPTEAAAANGGGDNNSDGGPEDMATTINTTTAAKEPSTTNSSSSTTTSSSSASRRSLIKANDKDASGLASGDRQSSTGSSAVAGAGSANSQSGEPVRKKRGGSRMDATVESEEQFCSKVEVKIKIPDELKPWLVDDWDAVTKQHKLVELPAKTTVQDIIDSYVQYKKSGKSVSTAKEPQILEVANGLIEYFNVTLGSQLLYKFERPQYAEVLGKHPDKPMSAIYGSVHLLRLFIKLGTMLAFTALDEKTIQLLLVHIHDFLKYMVKNSSTLFSMKHFVNASPEYHRQAQ